MKEPVDDSPRAERGAVTTRRGPRVGGRRVAALALAVLACLMLVHWLTYRVEQVSTDPAYIELIPPNVNGRPGGGASLSPSPTSADAARSAERADASLFTPASFSTAPETSETSADADARPRDEVVDASRRASSTQASPTPTPTQAARQSRPNFVRRLFRWVAGLFGRGKSRPNSPPVISGVSLSANKLKLTPRCPPGLEPRGDCPDAGGGVRLVVSANDADGDRLDFRFQPSAGRVDSERPGDPHAAWDLTGVEPGTHELSVVALERADGSGESAARSEPFRVRLSVEECECAPPASALIRVSAPEYATVSRPVTFNAEISGGDPDVTPTFNWTVSAGAITSGQGTSSITVDTTGLPAGTQVTATVEVGGYSRYVQSTAISTTQIINQPDRPKIKLIGVVSDAADKGVAGAAVKVYSSDRVEVASATTNEKGQFSVRLAYGEYYAVATKDGFTSQSGLTFHSPNAYDYISIKLPTTAPTPLPSPSTTPTTEPSPRPDGTPTASPTPTPAASPTPAPSPTPSASATPLNLKRVGQDRITVERPERFLEGQTETVTCALAMVETFVIASETFENGAATVIDKPGPVAGALNPELARAFGESYTSHARFALESDDLEFSLASPEHNYARPVPAEVGQSAEWVWQARLKEGRRGPVSYKARLDVVWKPKAGGGEEIVRRGVWEREFKEVPTGLPLTVRASKYGSGAAGLAALGAFVVPGRRRRLEELESELEGGRPPAPAAPPAPEAVADEVLCTVYAKREARPGDAFLVQAFAHLAAQADALAARARKADETAEERGSETLESPVERGSRLTFTLQMPGLEIDEPSQTFVWKGDAKLVQFGVNVPADCGPKSVVGKLTVCQESVPVGHVRFTLNVVAAAAHVSALASPTAAPPPQGELPAGEFVRYRQAFISYSSKDRAEVLRRTQMLRLVRLNFRQDLLELEPGQEWEAQLYKWIDESDVFFLFWSSAAKASPWVEKELQYALRRKGERDEAPPEIVPVILEGPPPVAPPPYLSSRHFNDTFLYFLRVEDQLKAAACGPQPAPTPPDAGAA